MFDQNNPLTPWKALIGGGLQFLGHTFKNESTDEHIGILLFHADCVAMDYTRYTTPAKVKGSLPVATKVNPNLTSFLQYAISDKAAEDEMLLAGARNISDTGLVCLVKEFQYIP